MEDSEKRILITEVSGDCRYLRVQVDPLDDDPGTYCAANLKGNWEKIDTKECKRCKRKNRFRGITRKEAIERMAEAIYGWEPLYNWKKYKKIVPEGARAYIGRAADALDALLGGRNG